MRALIGLTVTLIILVTAAVVVHGNLTQGAAPAAFKVNTFPKTSFNTVNQSGFDIKR